MNQTISKIQPKIHLPIFLLLALFCLLSFNRGLAADVLTLKQGYAQVKGTILNITSTSIIIKDRNNDSYIIPKKKVDDICFESSNRVCTIHNPTWSRTWRSMAVPGWGQYYAHGYQSDQFLVGGILGGLFFISAPLGISFFTKYRSQANEARNLLERALNNEDVRGQSTTIQQANTMNSDARRAFNLSNVFIGIAITSYALQVYHAVFNGFIPGRNNQLNLKKFGKKISFQGAPFLRLASNHAWQINNPHTSFFDKSPTIEFGYHFAY